MCCGEDAIDEDNLFLCCALCCLNCSCLPTAGCLGCSGKCGICCLNAELCCKPGAPCLCPCCCLGCKCQNNECAILNGQVHCCPIVVSAAVPCNDEVPVALAVAGLTVFPRCGCCLQHKDLKMDR